MGYYIRATEDVEYCQALHVLTFPGDDWYESDAYWLVWDETDTAMPVGFCGVKELPTEKAAFLTRSGVLPCATGHHLQRRMITTREHWARTQGLETMITYCLISNPASVANLIKAGYHIYTPEFRWAGTDDSIVYFIKTL